MEPEVEAQDGSFDGKCFNQEFADCVATLCHSKYASLPKTGKPKKDFEWTVLSAVVLVRGGCSRSMEVVSLATGSKCIGMNKMSPKGDILNDSHAEVLARRGFLRYLYHQILLTKNGSTSEVLIENETKRYSVRPDITFHLYCSHTPCGDASILPKTTFSTDEDEFGVCVSNPSKRSSDDEDAGVIAKRPKLEGSGDEREKRPDSDWTDIHRTGAKCIPNDAKQDERVPGSRYHVLGAVRTKPGRGDPTLSVSCSDKIMRWNCVGIQGALLSLLLTKPVYLRSIVIGGGCPFSTDALKRALVDRVSPARSLLPPNYCINNPVFLQASIPFPDGRFCSEAPQPCPSSLIWCSVPQRNLEVAVEGKKQGATKKSQNTRSGRLLVSKTELLRVFESIRGTQNAEHNNLKNYAEDSSDPVSSSALIIKEDSVVACVNDINEVQKTFTERTVNFGGNNRLGNFRNSVIDCNKICGAKYSDIKTESSEYRSTWAVIRSTAGLSWTKKNPNLLDFSTDDELAQRVTQK